MLVCENSFCTSRISEGRPAEYWLTLDYWLLCSLLDSLYIYLQKRTFIRKDHNLIPRKEKRTLWYFLLEQSIVHYPQNLLNQQVRKIPKKREVKRNKGEKAREVNRDQREATMVRYTPEGLSLARSMWPGQKGEKNVVICPQSSDISLCRRQRRITRYDDRLNGLLLFPWCWASSAMITGFKSLDYLCCWRWTFLTVSYSSWVDSVNSFNVFEINFKRSYKNKFNLYWHNHEKIPVTCL